MDISFDSSPHGRLSHEIEVRVEEQTEVEVTNHLRAVRVDQSMLGIEIRFTASIDWLEGVVRRVQREYGSVERGPIEVDGNLVNMVDAADQII